MQINTYQFHRDLFKFRFILPVQNEQRQYDDDMS